MWMRIRCSKINETGRKKENQGCAGTEEPREMDRGRKPKGRVYTEKWAADWRRGSR